MKFIKGASFGVFAHKGLLSKPESRKSLDELTERTGADFIILVPNGLQDTPQSESIDFSSPASMDDDELKSFIEYAHSKGVRTALKPTVNCRNGTWRAHISFFDEDVVCEPKWCNWFDSYSEFQKHYAAIASQMGCEMFIAGCEMVQSEHREDEWRAVISDIRSEYKGTVSYNTDKYREHSVKWWDAVDVISSSGYYPIDKWEQELDRIEPVVKKFGKPFFFAECGCMSTAGSQFIPNNWAVKGDIDMQVQADWYQAMFDACEKRSWVEGFAFWDWALKHYPPAKADTHGGYDIYGKTAEKVVCDFYSRH